MPSPSATKITSIVVADAGQGEAERGAHERRRARRRDDDGENARAERVERAILRRPARHAGRRELTELEDAGQVEREHEEEDGERAHDRGRLQLEAPAQLFPAGPQRGERRAQRDERQHDAARERDGFVAHRRAGVLVCREAEHFQREHRKNARHEIEDEAADERRDDGDGERDGIAVGASSGREIERGRGGRRRLGPRGDAAGHGDVDRRRARVAESRLAAVTTPARRSSGPASVCATGRATTYALPSRVTGCGPEGSILSATYGKKRITPGSAAPVGADQRELDRRAAARGARLPTRERRGEAPRAPPRWQRPIADLQSRLRPPAATA